MISKFVKMFIIVYIIFSYLTYISKIKYPIKSIGIKLNLDKIIYISKNPISLVINDIFPPKIHKQLVDEYFKLRNLSQNRVGINTKIIHSDILYSQKSLISRIFHSPQIEEQISKLLNKQVKATPVNHPYSNFIQISENAKHGLEWHYDLNFYKGTTLVGLYTLINEGTKNGKFSHQVHYQEHGKKKYCVVTKPNSLVLFDAANILHTACGIKDNEKRVVYQTLVSSNLEQGYLDLIKMYFFTTEGMHLLRNKYKKTVLV